MKKRGSPFLLLLLTLLTGCGQPSSPSGPTPQPLVATALVAGATQSCAVSNGQGWCWGEDGQGELGDGGSSNTNVPVRFSLLGAGQQLLAIAVGGYDGTPTAPTAPTSCVILASGAVQCWGLGIFGALGNGQSASSAAPVPVSGLTSGATAIALGSSFACAIVNGGAWCWGSNDVGQLGNGTYSSSSVPVQVTGLTSGVTAIAAEASAGTACAIVGGGVQCWGNGYAGQLGNGTCADTGNGDVYSSNVPVQVSGIGSGATAIAVGADHACAVVLGGVQCWGNSADGQAGNTSGNYAYASGCEYPALYTTPVPVQGITTGATAVSAGDAFSCAVVGGGARCWGYDLDGELGNGSFSNYGAVATPVQVSGLTSGALAVASAGTHSCASLAGGGVVCWGDDFYGELGNGSNAMSAVPAGVFPTVFSATVGH